MTFVVGNARELTNSRNRLVKQARSWVHNCYREPIMRVNRSLTTYSCADCGARRPK